MAVTQEGRNERLIDMEEIKKFFALADIARMAAKNAEQDADEIAELTRQLYGLVGGHPVRIAFMATTMLVFHLGGDVDNLLTKMKQQLGGRA